MVGDVLRLGLAVFSILKHLNRVEKIPIVVVVNSDVIFGVIFMMLSDSK